MKELTDKAILLLKQLIETPSMSREENKTADLIQHFLDGEGMKCERLGNNVWIKNKCFDSTLPTILLNSHHDTVKPNTGYTKNPYEALVEDGKLYGLGSNDAGGCLVSLLATFLHFYNTKNLSYNLIFAASAEEEISGKGGIESLLPQLPTIDFAIVGEPTLMQLAVAEKGLMVLDCTAYGQAGHAARDEGENALYKAMQSVEWFRTFAFPKVSENLGPVKMSVTVIEAGKQHNVVPDTCRFVVDVRTTDAYTNEETLAIIRDHVDCEVIPRSTRLNPSGIGAAHPIVRAGIALGRQTYGSPTLSDQALMPFPSVKLGPGDSARSHTADEYVRLDEIEEGVNLYIKILESIVHSR
jgi:acetylornithine deacetylase